LNLQTIYGPIKIEYYHSKRGSILANEIMHLLSDGKNIVLKCIDDNDFKCYSVNGLLSFDGSGFTKYRTIDELFADLGMDIMLFDEVYEIKSDLHKHLNAGHESYRIAQPFSK